MRLSLLLALLSLTACELTATDTGKPDDTSGGADDGDGDGYINDEDCDDTNADIHAGATELCDEVDNDCDGEVDEGASDGNTYFADGDSDSYGAGDAITACSQPSGTVTNDDDCDDDIPRVHPGADERCNGNDDDCDGDIDEDAIDETEWYADADDDGYGDPDRSRLACDAPEGSVDNGGDCDDDDDTVHPGATELCNGTDDDCDGDVDEGVTSGVWYADTDGDTYGDPSTTTESCTQPAGTSANGDDCDDTDAAINPAAAEVCDLVDNDCDGTVDLGATDAEYLYLDADGDGLGDGATYDLYCFGVANGDDCDDTDADEPQVVDASATGTPDGSVVNPWTTIQDGIDAANTCVIVAPGVYEENIDFGGKDILVRGVSGAQATIIDAQGSGVVATFNSGEGAGAELVGFTLVRGAGFEEETTSTRSCGSSSTCTDHHTVVCGGGIYVDGAAPTLHALTVKANVVDPPADSSSGNDYYYYFGFGGGICARNTSLFMDGVNVEQNAADDGGGIYIEDTASIEFKHGNIVANTGENGAGVMVDGGSFTVSNSIFAWNSASNAGGGIHAVDATLEVTNVTFGENEAPATSGGGINATGTTTLTLLNTILYGADAGYGLAVGTSTSYTGSYNDAYGNLASNYTGITDPTGSSGNISADPSFSSVTDDGDYTNDVWTLASGSSCIDAGNPSATYDDSDSTANDMGAFGGPEGAW